MGTRWRDCGHLRHSASPTARDRYSREADTDEDTRTRANGHSDGDADL